MDIHIEEFNHSFVLYFGGEFGRINAYTLATTLVSVADAVKYTNTQINPGYEVEVVVEALADGSFKAQIGALYKGAQNLFTAENAKAIALSIVATFIYQKAIAPDNDVKVIVNDDSVVIEQEDKRIIVPREVHDAAQEIEKNPEFRSDMARAFHAIGSDSDVQSFGITPHLDDPEPSLQVPSQRLREVGDQILETDSTSREVIEIVDLQIVRAILERSKRRWEFVWRGVKISGPVLDEQFYNDFFAHRITIAPGDILRARMRINQQQDPDTGIFLNRSYEIIEVQDHIPRMRQRAADFGEDDV